MLDLKQCASGNRLLVGFFIITVVVILLFLSVHHNNLNSQGSDSFEIELVSEGMIVDTINAETARTRTELYTGLSNRETLNDGKGMIFIYDRSSDRTFVMRDMDFGLDIVFIGSNCSVNSIEHAEKPKPRETGTEVVNQYNGTGKYVLELPYKYTDDRISKGDSVSFDGC